MTLKDISIQVDNLRQIIGEKDIIIKTLEDKMISLQQWTQDMYSTLSNRVNASEQNQQAEPKIFHCESCSEEFDQTWKLEQHMNLNHTIEKSHKCDTCEKTFALRWRLQKHIRGHQQDNVKFCHFFNNNKTCPFNEISGCMFKHQNAPTCKFPQRCRFQKCQFSHSDVGDHVSETDTDESAQEFEGEAANGESDSNQTKKTNVTHVRCDYGL